MKRKWEWPHLLLPVVPALAAGLLCAAPARSEASVAPAPLSLKQAIEIAEAKSPDIRQLQEQLDSASAKKRLALAPTEPSLSINFNDMISPFSLSSTAGEVLQINQPVGFPGRAFLNRSQLGDQAEAVYYQLKSMKLQVSFNIKQAYYGLDLARRNIELNRDTKLAYERILASARTRYETGQTTQVDYLNAQLALLSTQNDLTDLQTSLRQARAQLNVLLANPPEAPIEIQPVEMVYRPPIDLDEAIGKMLTNRNEIKAAQSQVSASDKAYKLAWMSVLPDFQLTAGTTIYRNPYTSPYSSAVPADFGPADFPTRTYMAGIQLTVPIWFLFNEREAIVGASHDRAAADAALDVVYEQSKPALEAAVDTVNSLAIKIENFERHLLPLSDQALNLAMVNYAAGKIDFQTLSDTAAARRTVRLNYASAVVSYLTNYATYGQLIGEDL